MKNKQYHYISRGKRGRAKDDVSVVIPHFNSVETLRRALISVFKQVSLPSQIIVVDDFSTEVCRDEVRNLLSKKYYKNRVTLILHDHNKGASAARNTGILASSGYYVALLDSDDAWHPYLLKKQIDILKEQSADIVCAKYKRFESNLLLPSITPYVNVRCLRLWDFVFCNPVKTPTVVFKRQINLIFPEDLMRCEDFYAFVSIICSGRTFLYNKDVLAYGFKDEIGHSGLTFDASIMHHALIKAFKFLYINKIIRLHIFLSMLIIESIKYPLRKIKLYLRNFT